MVCVHISSRGTNCFVGLCMWRLITVSSVCHDITLVDTQAEHLFPTPVPVPERSCFAQEPALEQLNTRTVSQRPATPVKTTRMEPVHSAIRLSPLLFLVFSFSLCALRFGLKKIEYEIQRLRKFFRNRVVANFCILLAAEAPFYRTAITKYKMLLCVDRHLNNTGMRAKGTMAVKTWIFRLLPILLTSKSPAACYHLQVKRRQLCEGVS